MACSHCGKGTDRACNYVLGLSSSGAPDKSLAGSVNEHISCTGKTPQLALLGLALAIVKRQTEHIMCHKGAASEDKTVWECHQKELDDLKKKLQQNTSGITYLPASVRVLLAGFDEEGSQVLIRNRIHEI